MDALLIVTGVSLFVVIAALLLMAKWLIKQRWRNVLGMLIAGLIGGLVGYVSPGTSIGTYSVRGETAAVDVSFQEARALVGIATGFIIGVAGIGGLARGRRNA